MKRKRIIILASALLVGSCTAYDVYGFTHPTPLTPREIAEREAAQKRYDSDFDLCRTVASAAVDISNPAHPRLLGECMRRLGYTSWQD